MWGIKAGSPEAAAQLQDCGVRPPGWGRLYGHVQAPQSGCEEWDRVLGSLTAGSWVLPTSISSGKSLEGRTGQHVQGSSPPFFPMDC